MRYRQAVALQDPKTGETQLLIKAESPAEKESIRRGLWLRVDPKKAKQQPKKKED
jgi:hypothetical protein